MSKLILQPAVKELKPMKVLMYGPTYSGKTLSSLYMAAGVVMNKRGCKLEDAYKHIVLIDTEYGRGALHSSIGPYNYIKIDAPYYTEKLDSLMDELAMFDEVDVIIIDSLTHFWVKDGGILDQKAAKDKQGGNSYTNWQEFTAKFNRTIDNILASPKHVFVTARAKTDTVVSVDGGKAVPRTYGLKPELREGIDFDFDIVFNVDKTTHDLIVDKGVPGMEPMYEMAKPDTGYDLLNLFNAGAIIKPRTEQDLIGSISNLAKNYNQVQFIGLELSGKKLPELTLDELVSLESKVLANIKKGQAK